MKTTLHGIRSLLALLALLGAALVGCDDKKSQPPPQPPPSQKSIPVRFDVTAPAGTPGDASVAVIGNQAALGNGRFPGLALTRESDGHFRGSAELPVGQSVSYSLWLVSPSSVEVGADGVPLVARTFTVEDRSEIDIAATVHAWSEPSDPARPPITFAVEVPAHTPADAEIWLSGNQPELGNWSGAGVKLTRSSSSNRYTARVSFDVGAELEFRVTRGTWNTVELDELGHPVPNHTLRVSPLGRVDIPVANWRDLPPISFVVEVPANTPSDAEVWLSGNQRALGNWSGAGVKLTKRSSDSRYVTRLPFAVGTHLEFKVTRGSWDSVEKDAQGGEISNHTHTVSAPALVSVSVGSWRDLGPVDPQPDTLTGNIQYHDVEGSSVGLKDRKLIVWLPPGYDTQTTARYPVLYMHDGQNLMNARTAAFGVEWGVDETAQSLVEAGQIEPLIIVGVYNTEDRTPEYTHVAHAPHGGGKAEDYGRLLVEVVKPLIDDTYRTRPEAQDTGVAGSSLGGLVSMYFGTTRSSTFTRLGVVSPSVWWAERDIVTRVNELDAKPPMMRIWLDIGTNEGSSSSGSQETVNDTRALRDALLAKGWVLDDDLKYLEADQARHNEAAWAARTGQILKFLYPPVP
jgi:predicted alpha/beta superfamily hydrolase